MIYTDAMIKEAIQEELKQRGWKQVKDHYCSLQGKVIFCETHLVVSSVACAEALIRGGCVQLLYSVFREGNNLHRIWEIISNALELFKIYGPSLRDPIFHSKEIDLATYSVPQCCLKIVKGCESCCKSISNESCSNGHLSVERKVCRLYSGGHAITSIAGDLDLPVETVRHILNNFLGDYLELQQI